METLRLMMLTCVTMALADYSEPMIRNHSSEELLMDRLFQGYHPSARPVLDSSNTVKVTIGFSLLQIQELDLRSQVFTSTGLIVLEWVDERLVWNLSTYPIPEIVVEANKIWRPEFASINGAEGIYGEYGHFRAMVSSEGRIHWEPGGIFKTICEVDITYYPFDTQECRLVFGAWSYHTAKMNLTTKAKVVNRDSYESNGEWEIVKTEVERNEFNFDCCPHERFSNVAFIIRMRRRYTFYIMNVILPSIMTSVLLLSIFFCTPAQKVQIGVVVLLSFRIFLLNVTDSIPKTSDHIPLLGIYLTCTMAITTVSMVLTVLVLNLHHVNDRPVPAWVRKLILDYTARVMCMSRPEYRETTPRRGWSKYANFHMKKKPPPTLGIQVGLLAAMNGSAKLNSRIANGCPDFGVKPNQIGDKERKDDMASRYKVEFSYSKKIKKDTGKTVGKEEIREESMEDKYSREWNHVAEVVDRLFFWLFFIAIMVTTLLLFQPLTRAYLDQEEEIINPPKVT